MSATAYKHLHRLAAAVLATTDTTCADLPDPVLDALWALQTWLAGHCRACGRPVEGDAGLCSAGDVEGCRYRGFRLLPDDLRRAG